MIHDTRKEPRIPLRVGLASHSVGFSKRILA
jgi:hypothetical protein